MCRADACQIRTLEASMCTFLFPVLLASCARDDPMRKRADFGARPRERSPSNRCGIWLWRSRNPERPKSICWRRNGPLRRKAGQRAVDARRRNSTSAARYLFRQPSFACPIFEYQFDKAARLKKFVRDRFCLGVSGCRRE